MFSSADVKKMLVEYRDQERDIDLQYERLDALETRLYSVGSPEITDMPRNPSPSNDRISVLIERHIKLKQKVEMLCADRDKKREEFENIINMVALPEQRATIQMHYLDGHKWDTVNEMIFGTEDEFEDKRDSYMRRIMILHGQALQQMADVMNSRK